MLDVVLPVFSVILIGYIFGIKNTVSKDAESLINTYVLFIALPALLFLSVAQAKPSDLLNSTFIIASLLGIFIAYLAGIGFASLNSVRAPESSIIGMASCYGTVGYMGIPILIMAFGEEAALPAAIATILHNIPAIMTVIITHEVKSQKNKSLAKTVYNALLTTLKNPLTLAVLLGILFSALSLDLPIFLSKASGFLAGAAGPTALFALGVGLSHIKISKQKIKEKYKWILSTITFKILLQPAVTFLAIIALTDSSSIENIWHISAIIMAAQPIGAGAYMFANKYDSFNEEVSLSIILSLLVTLFSISYLLQRYA